MAAQLMIGLWIARFSDHGYGGPMTKWHLVESEIVDRKVTKCGRQMGDIAGTVLAPLATPPLITTACKACST